MMIQILFNEIVVHACDRANQCISVYYMYVRTLGTVTCMPVYSCEHIDVCGTLYM